MVLPGLEPRAPACEASIQPLHHTVHMPEQWFRLRFISAAIYSKYDNVCDALTFKRVYLAMSGNVCKNGAIKMLVCACTLRHKFRFFAHLSFTLTIGP